MSGTLFNIQRFCTDDGPGIRTTVFFKGCNLSCAWCHNPESQSGKVQLMFFADKCIGCGKCENHCPQHIAIRQELKNAKKELEGPLYRLIAFFVRKLKIFG